MPNIEYVEEPFAITVIKIFSEIWIKCFYSCNGEYFSLYSMLGINIIDKVTIPNW